jgi:hypothetical protein
MIDVWLNFVDGMKKVYDEQSNEFYLFETLDQWIEYYNINKQQSNESLSDTEKKELEIFWDFMKNENKQNNMVIVGVFIEKGLRLLPIDKKKIYIKKYNSSET